MRESEFIRQNKQKWEEFEGLVKGKEKAPRKLTELFVQITDDLSFARTFYPNRSVRVYLNYVSQRVFQKVYRPRKVNFRSIPEFWAEDLPQLLYHSRRDIQISFIVFLLALTIGIVSGYNDATFPDLILGESYVSMTEENIENGDPMYVYKDDRPSGMFWRIFLNNLGVDILTFFSGLLMAIGSLFVILINGVMVGSFQYFFIERDLFLESFLTIWQHGTVEMAAMVLSGAAGIGMGRGLAFPGTYSRMQSFRLSAVRSLKIMALVFVMTVIAAVLESWVTRYTEIPDLLRGAAILSWLVLIYIYVWWYPALLSLRGFKKPFGVEKLPAPEKIDIELDRVKSIGEMFTETFAHYQRISRAYIPKALIALAFVSIGIAVAYTYNWIDMFSFQLGKGGDLFVVIERLPYLLSLFFQFADYQQIPWFIPVNLALTVFAFLYAVEPFSAYKGQPDSIKKGGSKWVSRLYALVPLSMLHACYLLVSGWGFFLSVLIFPYLILWAVIIIHEKVSLTNALRRAFQVAKGNHGTLLGLFWGVMLLVSIVVFLINSPLVSIYVQFVQTVLPLDGNAYEIVNASYVTFVYYVSVFALLPLLFSCINLFYYHAREAQEGHGLKARLKEFGNTSVLARRFLTIALLVCCFAHAPAQVENADSTMVYQEYAEPDEIRDFDKDAWNEARADLDYSEAPIPVRTVGEEEEPQEEKAKGTPMFLKVLLYTLGAAVLILIFYLLSKEFIIPVKEDKLQAENLDDIEDIADFDLETMLLNAESEGRWKDAIRLQFLLVIQKLSDCEWIRWEKDKTNRDYLREMRPRATYKDFRDLALVFEQTWYGDATVTQQDFTAWSPRFQSYLSSISK